MPIDKRVAFVDTNYFMHFQPPEQIDWCSLLDAKEVLLVVAPVVVRELNEHKDGHKRPHLRERAVERIKKLLPWVAGGKITDIRPHVRITALTAEPAIDFAAHNLVKDIQDDWLIASVIVYRQGTESTDVIIVSDDAGLVLKAPGHGIDVVAPPEDARLPAQVDENEQELRKAKRELEAMKNAQPKLSFGFPNKQGTATVQIGKVCIIRLSRKLLGQIKRLETTSGEPFLTYRRNENFEMELEQYKKLVAHCVRLDFVLYNDGTSSGNDIDVHVEFGDAVLILREAPAEPEAVRDLMNVRMPHFDPIGANDTLQFDRSTAIFKVKTAKHNLPVVLDPIFVISKSDSTGNLSLSYRILCGNLPKPIDGKLNVIVETVDEVVIDGNQSHSN